MIVLVVLGIVLPCGGLRLGDDFLLVVDGILLAACALRVTEFDRQFFIPAVSRDDARALLRQDVFQDIACVVDGVADAENLLALRLGLLLLLLLLHPWRQRHSVLAEAAAHHAGHVAAGLETISRHAGHVSRLTETAAGHVSGLTETAAGHVAAHAVASAASALLLFHADDDDWRLAELRDAAQLQFGIRGLNGFGILRSFRFNEFRAIRIEEGFLPDVVQCAHADLRGALFRLACFHVFGCFRVFGGILRSRLLDAGLLL